MLICAPSTTRTADLSALRRRDLLVASVVATELDQAMSGDCLTSDVAEDTSTIRAGTTPRAMATIRNLAIGTLKILGADNIAKTTRAIRHEPERALAILGITNNPDTHGT
ncbi:hypothetical protein SGFS_056110 [Streptomyces graminofaciens]|uniref:Transposase n=1 Tax=Streptomyces graminofaciens TaxID=68212 RepID=A0ABN5VLI2_9ACTN|nr:hypothetical protein SGFS_056110 [Streptomyces graminofaciens]